MCSVGSFVQAPSPVSAADTPMSFSISRRPTPSEKRPGIESAAFDGNSFSLKFRNSCVSDSSSRLCQKRFSPSCASRARAAARSMELLGSVLIVPLSSVTRRTALHKVLVVNLVISQQLASQRKLVCIRDAIIRNRVIARRLLVKRVEYFRPGPQIFLGLPVTIQTP